MPEHRSRKRPENEDAVRWLAKNAERLMQSIGHTEEIMRLDAEIIAVQKLPTSIEEAAESLKLFAAAKREEIDRMVQNGLFMMSRHNDPQWYGKFGGDAAEVYFALIDPERIDQLAAEMVQADDSISDKERTKRRRDINKRRTELIRRVESLIPADMLAPSTSGSGLLQSQVFAAFSAWRDMQSSCVQACDPLGSSITDDNPFSQAHTILNMSRFINPNGRFKAVVYEHGAYA